MSGNRGRSRAVLGLLLLAVPMLVGATDSTATSDDVILALHNRERAAMGVPSLRWNAALAQSAQAWADHLAATGTFQHAPERPTNPQGENLWAGTKGYYSLAERVNAWIREKRFFKRGTFPDNSVTGEVEDVGHYTQLIWRDTREVGCAQASGERDDILVCRYSSAGNYLGERVY